MMVIIGDDNGDDEIGDAEGAWSSVSFVIIMTVGDAEDAR